MCYEKMRIQHSATKVDIGVHREENRHEMLGDICREASLWLNVQLDI